MRQDAYSLRCVPQILGPVWETLRNVQRTIEIEMNSIDGNPLIFPENKSTYHGGHFHGQPRRWTFSASLWPQFQFNQKGGRPD